MGLMADVVRFAFVIYFFIICRNNWILYLLRISYDRVNLIQSVDARYAISTGSTKDFKKGRKKAKENSEVVHITITLDSDGFSYSFWACIHKTPAEHNIRALECFICW